MFTTDLETLIPEMRAYARMLCSDRHLADDIVQNACLKAWKARASFDPAKGNFKAWIFTITRNEFLQHVRKNKRVDCYAPTEFDAWLVEDCQNASRAACSDAIKELFALSREQRDVFILVVAAGYSYEEAAQICNCSIGTIKSRINRAREKLTSRLQAPEQDNTAPEPNSVAFHGLSDVLGYVDSLVRKAA